MTTLEELCDEKIKYWEDRARSYGSVVAYWKAYLRQRAAGEPLREKSGMEEWNIGFDIRRAEELLAKNQVVVDEANTNAAIWHEQRKRIIPKASPEPFQVEHLEICKALLEEYTNVLRGKEDLTGCGSRQILLSNLEAALNVKIIEKVQFDDR